MVMFLLHLLLFFLLISLNNTHKIERERRIVGGNPVKPGKYDYQVSLQKQVNLVWMHICGGALIKPEWVLTAAHCARNIPLHVVAGTHNLLQAAERIPVKLHIPHKHYNTKNKANDIGLLKLERPLEYSERLSEPLAMANLPHPTFQPTGRCYVTGWGKTSNKGTLSADLLVAQVPVVTFTSCHNLFLKLNDVKESMLCAGGLKKDACQGDSGGPLVCFEEDGSEVLSGITSWGLRCATVGYPGVYTKVSSFLKWIDKTIAENTETAAAKQIKQSKHTQRKGINKIQNQRRKWAAGQSRTKSISY